jgi:tRNA(fMet)-specific endonuclease VapC
VGVVLDSNVFIRAERLRKQVDFARWSAYGDGFISAITVSELLIGVHRAASDAQRIRRAAFVEAVLEAMPVLEFTAEVARIHAEVIASLIKQGQLIGANDLIIAATALCHGFPVLTSNTSEFQRIAGLEVLALTEPGG